MNVQLGASVKTLWRNCVEHPLALASIIATWASVATSAALTEFNRANALSHQVGEIHEELIDYKNETQSRLSKVEDDYRSVKIENVGLRQNVQREHERAEKAQTNGRRLETEIAAKQKELLLANERIELLTRQNSEQSDELKELGALVIGLKEEVAVMEAAYSEYWKSASRSPGKQRASIVGKTSDIANKNPAAR